MLPVDPGVVPEVVEAYRTAWGAWHSRVEALHAVAFDGRALAPPQHKSMLDARRWRSNAMTLPAGRCWALQTRSLSTLA